MPSPMAHFAVGAAVLALTGFKRREVAFGGLWAAAADLDAITAIPWVLAAPHVPLSADSLILIEHLLGHRGLSHTLPMAAFAGIGAWLYTKRARWGLVAGLAWVTHVVFDVFTVWTIEPYWPLAGTSMRYPLVTTLDPIVTIVSLAAIVALLAPWLVQRYEWSLDGWGGRLADWGKRWGKRLAVASLGAVLLNVAWIGAVAAVQDVPFEDTHSAHIPRTVTLVEHEDAWEIQERWTPFSEGDTRFVPKMDNRTHLGDAGAAVGTVECALEGLGPYNNVDEPVYVVRPGGQVLLVEVHDIVRNATGGGPVMLFSLADGEIQDAWSTGEETQSFYRIPVPSPVLEAARCP